MKSGLSPLHVFTNLALLVFLSVGTNKRNCVFNLLRSDLRRGRERVWILYGRLQDEEAVRDLQALKFECAICDMYVEAMYMEACATLIILYHL